MTPDALITVDRVSFGYDASRTILEDVSLTVARGRITAIMGGSGCGKTTLLRLIGVVHAPNKGAIRFDGEVIDTRDRNQVYRLRRRLGMLFQFGALFNDLTVFDNIAFPLREHTDLPESMVRDVVLMELNAVGLRGAPQPRIAEVSGGMARRIALARAIALDPFDFYGQTRTVDVHVAHLRKKLEPSSVKIETLTGVCYKLVMPPPSRNTPGTL